MASKKNTAVSDEQIIAALMSHNTVAEAGAAVGLSPRAMYDRMSDGEFKTLYRAAKADIIKAATATLNNKVQQAINTMTEIMENKDVTPAIRLQAATAILNHAGKFAERLDVAESMVLAQIASNNFDVFNLNWG